MHTVYPLQKFFVSFVGAPDKVGWEVVEVVEKAELSALRRREGGDVSRSSMSRDAAVHRIQRGAGYFSMSGVAKTAVCRVSPRDNRGFPSQIEAKNFISQKIFQLLHVSGL